MGAAWYHPPRRQATIFCPARHAEKNAMTALLRPLVPLLLLASVAPAAAAPQVWLNDVAAAEKAAAERDAFILVDLYADWCGWCKVLEREVFSSEAFRRFASDFVLLRVDVEDGGEGSLMQARYGVVDLPTLLILEAGGARVGQVSGYAPVERYLAQLRAELKRYEELVGHFEAVRRSGDAGALSALAEAFHRRRDGARAAALYDRLAAELKPGSPQWADVQARLADARRLAGDWAGARQSLERARAAARSLDDRRLLEQVELLHVQIAQEAGDCDEAERSLESFLRDHPESPLRREARRALAALRRGEPATCG